MESGITSVIGRARWNLQTFPGSTPVAESPDKVESLSDPAERMLQVIHLSAQVPINSWQNLLQFSSKPRADLFVGCVWSSAVAAQPELSISAPAHFSSSYLQLTPVR